MLIEAKPRTKEEHFNISSTLLNYHPQVQPDLTPRNFHHLHHFSSPWNNFQYPQPQSYYQRCVLNSPPFSLRKFLNQEHKLHKEELRKTYHRCHPYFAVRESRKNRHPRRHCLCLFDKIFNKADFPSTQIYKRYRKEYSRYIPFTANANENNDNVLEQNNIDVEIQYLNSLSKNFFIQDSNPQDLKSLWRNRRRSFNTNPLSSQDYFTPQHPPALNKLPDSHVDKEDTNFQHLNTFADKSAAENTNIPHSDNFVSKCFFKFGLQSNRKNDINHLRSPLDLSRGQTNKSNTAFKHQGNLQPPPYLIQNKEKYSKNQRKESAPPNKPLNNNTNATVCLDQNGNPIYTPSNEHQIIPEEFRITPYSFNKCSLRPPSSFQFNCERKFHDSVAARKYHADKHSSLPTRSPPNFEEFEEKYLINSLPSGFHNPSSLEKLIQYEHQEGLIAQRSREGLLLAVAKRNQEKLHNPFSTVHINTPHDVNHCYNTAHTQNFLTCQQHQFTQNNQHATNPHAYCELIQNSASHTNFRPESPITAHLHSNHFHNEHNRHYRVNSAFVSNDMGCIQSLAKSKVSPGKYQGIIVDDIQATIDRSPTEIEEKSPIVLRYRTPYFRASASVIVPPIPKDETWTVGWIQACDAMKFVNQYGDLGSSSWEIPALKQKMVPAVSDSDGVSYPWYGNTTEIATIEGPTDTPRHLLLRMNDNFYPSVTWDIPVSEGSEAHLTHIIRDQSFTTWLAAVNQNTGVVEVLRTVKWHFLLEIEVDPTQKLGKRSRIISNLEQQQPIVLPYNTDPVQIVSPRKTVGSRRRKNYRRHGNGDNNSNNHVNQIPKSALVRPSANNAQTLIWRPRKQSAIVVVPPKEEYKENNEVVWFTREPLMHGKEPNVRILTKEEMVQFKKTVC